MSCSKSYPSSASSPRGLTSRELTKVLVSDFSFVYLQVDQLAAERSLFCLLLFLDNGIPKFHCIGILRAVSVVLWD